MKKVVDVQYIPKFLTLEMVNKLRAKGILPGEIRRHNCKYYDHNGICCICDRKRIEVVRCLGKKKKKKMKEKTN